MQIWPLYTTQCISVNTPNFQHPIHCSINSIHSSIYSIQLMWLEHAITTHMFFILYMWILQFAKQADCYENAWMLSLLQIQNQSKPTIYEFPVSTCIKACIFNHLCLMEFCALFKWTNLL